MTNRDYGAVARIGIGVPQANPTVEPEFERLLPSSVAKYSVRLCSKEESPADRLREYLESLPETLGRYDTLQLDAFGFACTGSSYIVGYDRETEITSSLREIAGYRIVTATDAIHRLLSELNANRVAMVSPYPTALQNASVEYWRSRGVTIQNITSVDIGQADTRGIYELTSADAAAGLKAVDVSSTDAVLLSGTGMPSLRVLAQHGLPVPALSSNSALAWALLTETSEAVGGRQWVSETPPWEKFRPPHSQPRAG